MNPEEKGGEVIDPNYCFFFDFSIIYDEIKLFVFRTVFLSDSSNWISSG